MHKMWDKLFIFKQLHDSRIKRPFEGKIVDFLVLLSLGKLFRELISSMINALLD